MRERACFASSSQDEVMGKSMATGIHAVTRNDGFFYELSFKSALGLENPSDQG